MEAEWMARATRDADECARAEAHAMVDVLEARISELETALKKIADPIAWLQSTLKPGESIDGPAAIALSKDAGWMQATARRALEN